jgi:hypothetical protein
LRAWKAAFIEKAPTLFEESKTARKAVELERRAAEEKANMLKTIGQLTMERDFMMTQVHANNKGVLLRR